MAFSPEVERRVWERAGGLCEDKLPNGKRCFGPGAEFHHKTLKKIGGRKGAMKKFIDSEENCMLVCLRCHRRRHGG